MTPEEYDDLALHALRELLRREHAIVGIEAEARISDFQSPDAPMHLDPHHITNARKMLIAAGELEVTRVQTRGGQVIDTLSLYESPSTAVERAAARKRLLQGRFLGWATGTRRYPNGLIGPAGERVLQSSLLAAAPAGYRPLPGDKTGIPRVLGDLVPTGPLDGAAILTRLDHRDIPMQPLLVAAEAKNVRSWLYPNSDEIYQLLEKAALIQRAHPQIPVFPVLLCRRAHFTLHRMAKHLGFAVIQSRTQYLLNSDEITPEALAEVRDELGYLDLQKQETDHRVADRFANIFPQIVDRSIERWHRTAHSSVFDLFKVLRRSNISPQERGGYMDDLRIRAAELPGEFQSGW